MRFVTADERSELRTPKNDDTQNGFQVSSATASLSGTVRLPSSTIGDSDNYTWMQVALLQ